MRDRGFRHTKLNGRKSKANNIFAFLEEGKDGAFLLLGDH